VAAKARNQQCVAFGNTRRGLDKGQLLNAHYRWTDEHLGIFNLDLARLTKERQVADPAPFEPMNASTSPDASSNRFDPPITSARNAHGCALCVVLNPLNNLPLIPHNPYRDGCSHIVCLPVS